MLGKTTNVDGVFTKESMRVCLDPRDCNKRVKRKHYYTRTLDKVVTQLHYAKFFSIIDAKKGYWNVSLGKQSLRLMATDGPFSSYRFTGLPFGLIVSLDVFKKGLDTTLKGVTGIADDNFVYGSTEKKIDEI